MLCACVCVCVRGAARVGFKKRHKPIQRNSFFVSSLFLFSKTNPFSEFGRRYKGMNMAVCRSCLISLISLSYFAFLSLSLSLPFFLFSSYISLHQLYLKIYHQKFFIFHCVCVREREAVHYREGAFTQANCVVMRRGDWVHRMC